MGSVHHFTAAGFKTSESVCLPRIGWYNVPKHRFIIAEVCFQELVRGCGIANFPLESLKRILLNISLRSITINCKVIYGPGFFFWNFRQRSSFSHYQVLKKDHQRWHRRKKRSKYTQCDSVVFCNLVARNLLQFSHRNLNEVELKDDRCIGAFHISIFQHNLTIKRNRIEQLLMEENSKATT